MQPHLRLCYALRSSIAERVAGASRGLLPACTAQAVAVELQCADAHAHVLAPVLAYTASGPHDALAHKSRAQGQAPGEVCQGVAEEFTYIVLPPWHCASQGPHTNRLAVAL